MPSQTTTVAPAETVEAAPRRTLRVKAKRDYREFEEGDDDSGDEEVVIPVKKRKIAKKPLPPNKIFPFMSLPPELRERVYEFALAGPSGAPPEEAWLVSRMRRMRRSLRCVYLGPKFVGQKEKPWGDGSHFTPFDGGDRFESKEEQGPEEAAIKSLGKSTNLLCVSRQVFEEAARWLYPPTFVVEDTVGLFRFLNKIGPGKRRFVEKIVLKGWGQGKVSQTSNFPALSMLQHLPSLKSFVFDCEVERYYRYHQGKPVFEEMLATRLFRDGHAWFEAVEGAPETISIADLERQVDDGNTKMDTVDKAHAFIHEEIRRLRTWSYGRAF